MDATSIDRDALAAAVKAAEAAYAGFEGLKLDLTRGKPSSAQLDLSEPMLTALQPGDHTASGVDVRNYGPPAAGLVELREMFAPLLGVPVDQLVARDNASLSLMHQCMSMSFFHALPGGSASWAGQQVKFLAPSPGYDRHFAVASELGVELITVPMTADGPDMDVVESLVRDDPSVKGIWCVPKYSNPTGVTYSDEVVRRLAAMPTAADDFRLYWDNAYAIHHLTGDHAELLDILTACAEAGHADRPFVFGSTSKVTFAGGGVSFFGSSPANVAWYLARDFIRAIGPDKVNQLRHVRFFGDTAGVEAHMREHAAIITPKFAAVRAALAADLGPLGIAKWTDPKGGYFVSLDTVPGTAKRIVELAKGVGVALTPAGATYPHGHDPEDANLRIAPTLPPLAEVEAAMKVLTTCVILATGERLL